MSRVEASGLICPHCFRVLEYEFRRNLYICDIHGPLITDERVADYLGRHVTR